MAASALITAKRKEKSIMPKGNNPRLHGIKGLCALMCAALLIVGSTTSCNGNPDAKADGENVQTEQAVEKKEVTVLRLTKAIAKGEKITSAKFEEVTLDQSLVWIGAISDKDKVIGKYSKIDLDPGDFLVDKYLEDAKEEEKPSYKLEEGSDFGYADLGYVVVSEYVKPDQPADVSAVIQRLIDANPKRTIYFPDGVYMISRPLVTPSDPNMSVSIKLSDNAVIKAAGNWIGEAMIMLGGKLQVNSITIPGSNYYLEGGTIDGSGITRGVSIEHGRETSVRDTNIINTTIGLVVKHGANGGSSDCDIENVRIFGNGQSNSIGLLIQGWDNTFSNMRISNVQTGVKVETAANLMRDIEVVYLHNPKLALLYASSCGFDDTGNRNWYDNCRSVQFRTAFRMRSDCMYTSCVASWPVVIEGRDQVMFETGSRWKSVARSCVANFTADASFCDYLRAAEGGKGYIEGPIFDPAAVAGERYKDHLVGEVVFPN